MDFKRIFRNITYLYGRLFFSILITLFSTRLIFNSLGSEDFGLFNLITGIVIFWSFINSTLSTATIRNLTFEIGKNNIEKTREIFSSSKILHIGIAFLIFFIVELVGVYSINNELNIKHSEIQTSIILLQLIIISTFINIISAPEEALINAKENIGFLSIIGILDSTLNLFIALILTLNIEDKLIIYGVLLLIKTFTVRIIKYLYCKINFNDIVNVNYFKSYNKKTLKQISIYAGWNLLGMFSFILKYQGIAFLINIFFGTILNASYAIANQINGQLQSFSISIVQAIQPRMTKSESSKDDESIYKLLLLSTKISFLILSIIGFCVIFNAKYMLTLWLKAYPDYTLEFCNLLILITIIQQLKSGITMVAHAKNKVKLFQFYNFPIQILCIPISYVILKYDNNPLNIFYTIFIIEIISVFINVIFLTKVLSITYYQFLVNIIIKNILTLSISFIVNYQLYEILKLKYENIILLINSSFLIIIIHLIISYIISNSAERQIILKLIKK